MASEDQTQPTQKVFKKGDSIQLSTVRTEHFNNIRRKLKELENTRYIYEGRAREAEHEWASMMQHLSFTLDLIRKDMELPEGVWDLSSDGTAIVKG